MDASNAAKLKQLYQAWLAQVNAAELRFAHEAVASIPGGLVNRDCSFILFMHVEKRFATACGSQRLMRCDKKRATDAETSVLGMDE